MRVQSHDHKSLFHVCGARSIFCGHSTHHEQSKLPRSQALPGDALHERLLPRRHPPLTLDAMYDFRRCVLVTLLEWKRDVDVQMYVNVLPYNNSALRLGSSQRERDLLATKLPPAAFYFVRPIRWLPCTVGDVKPTLTRSANEGNGETYKCT